MRRWGLFPSRMSTHARLCALGRVAWPNHSIEIQHGITKVTRIERRLLDSLWPAPGPPGEWRHAIHPEESPVVYHHCVDCRVSVLMETDRPQHATSFWARSLARTLSTSGTPPAGGFEPGVSGRNESPTAEDGNFSRCMTIVVSGNRDLDPDLVSVNLDPHLLSIDEPFVAVVGHSCLLCLMVCRWCIPGIENEEDNPRTKGLRNASVTHKSCPVHFCIPPYKCGMPGLENVSDQDYPGCNWVAVKAGDIVAEDGRLWD